MRRWLETAALSAAPLALGLLLRPDDPLLLRGSFPWLALAPLLAGLRHGFACGLGSALVLDGALLLLGARGAPPPSGAGPGGLALGMVLLGMLAGEACDRWERRCHRLEAETEQGRKRLQAFTRAYHLLAHSHGLLERHLVAGARSLRGALRDLQRRTFTPSAGRAADLAGLAEDMLALLAHHGALHAAALHPLRGGQLLEAAARLGSAPARAEPRDALLQAALREGQLHHVAEPVFAERARGTALIAAPLRDVGGRLWGVLLVYDLPFHAFHGEALRTLAVLCGALADVLMAAPLPALHGPLGLEQRFEQAQQAARRYGLRATALGLRFDPRRGGLTPERVRAALRQIDQGVRWSDRRGDPVLLLLLPLTDEVGLRGVLGRLDALAAAAGFADLADAGVQAHALPLDGQGSGAERLRALCARCAVWTSAEERVRAA